MPFVTMVKVHNHIVSPTNSVCCCWLRGDTFSVRAFFIGLAGLLMASKVGVFTAFGVGIGAYIAALPWAGVCWSLAWAWCAYRDAKADL